MRIKVRTILTTEVEVPGVQTLAEAVPVIERNDFRLPSTDGISGGWRIGAFEYVEGDKPFAPKIEVLHDRDPDTSCMVRLFADDHEVAAVDQVDIDPGAGWSVGDWDERIAGFEGTTTTFGQAAHQALIEGRGSKYIDRTYEQDVRGCSCGQADFGAPGHDGDANGGH